MGFSSVARFVWSGFGVAFRGEGLGRAGDELGAVRDCAGGVVAGPVDMAQGALIEDELRLIH
ncbi:hypothetical protein [Sphingobium sp. KCTC 72723]|uniref:hypothetical protein n=1 Tax=Sphingobium sp. KCTC 72723 TaxID=2733867 RepID=UPI00165DB7AD|nr:hypothetical protein [Sphingobium sp. KCTC 72723]